MNIHNLKHDAHVRHPGLPKSNWLSMNFRGFSVRRTRFMKMRMANAVALWVFGIEVVIRRPWLAGPARQLHPELFKGEQP